MSAQSKVALLWGGAIAFTAILMTQCLANPATPASTIQVKLNHARVLQLPAHTATVVLGNPIIANVTLLRKSNSLILTGKSFGQTNLIALDAHGHSLGESTVSVTEPHSDLVVQLGVNKQTYACDPSCQPTVDISDAKGYLQDVTTEITTRNNLAKKSN